MDASNASGDPEDSAAVTCANCRACCCRLEVLLMGDDDIPLRLTVEDRWGGWVMRRLGDGWCAALDRNTMNCTIYERRPGVCRDYPMGGSDCLVERSRMDKF
ncbi:flagellin N-methylase [mine drainage metagenome]|uniref:Flagellin N-methylase n=1 Tax=mine drainage metagenome TaxID=410659 RepID=A0A1J5RLP1_9ZZZZ